ncbi:MAG: hypothetical protein ISR90_02845 [Candidatus Marinimicrobia bacterium]|nr:hypothetical protein [Candidatus Neomarinimicrobiota bacterium]MBL7022977.1 hypothetical protein [Candidatus Neomarinimicrobiota bacterium]MBL7108795.1 hypothetical protein [Candidatus Neomarinimicrobiota bacterium]
MDLNNLSKKQLIGMIDDFAKNWLAHDGLWFQEVEKRFGINSAMDCDREAWRIFTVIEAKRIMKRHNIKNDSGLGGLKKALSYRLYSRLNTQSIVDESENSFVFQMNKCRVQFARKRKGLRDFPCKSVGIVEYSEFAKTIDPRIKTECVVCPPDKHPIEYYCAWRFSIN